MSRRVTADQVLAKVALIGDGSPPLGEKAREMTECVETIIVGCRLSHGR
jgi:hypothetical protein